MKRSPLSFAISRIEKSLISAGIASYILLGTPGPSFADLTIAATVKVNSDSSDAADSGSTDAPAPVTRTLTLKVQGKMSRAQVSGGMTAIYDGAQNRVYLLNAVDRTFAQLTVKQAAQFELTSRSGPTAPSLSSTADVDKTGITDTVLGRTVVKYTVAASVFPDPDSTSSPRRSGGRGGGGRRFPGGGNLVNPQSQDGGSQGQGGTRNRGPLLMAEGDYWVVDQTVVPIGSLALLPIIAQTVPEGPMLGPLYDKFAKLKIVPLSSKMTVDYKSRDNSGKQTRVISMEITAIRDEPLSAEVFEVPKDYVKVDLAAERRQLQQTQGHSDNSAPPAAQ